MGRKGLIFSASEYIEVSTIEGNTSVFPLLTEEIFVHINAIEIIRIFS